MRLRPAQTLAFTILLVASSLVACTANINLQGFVDTFKDVQDWGSFSRKYDLSRECERNEGLRVAYFTRHTGTLWDFISVASYLNLTWTNVNPGKIHELLPGHDLYDSTKELALTKWKAVGQMYCRMADTLQFCDVIPDARPLLEGNCGTPIILQVTNRYDFGVKDHAQYKQLLREASRRPNVWWVVNNPYDGLHLSKSNIGIPEDRISLLRPVGITMLPEPAPETYVQRASKFAILHRHQPLGKLVIKPFLVSRNLTDSIHEYDGEYGGPTVLAQYQGVIHVPYQVSVMKMYEGMAAGAAFVLPSDIFFVSLLRKYETEDQLFFADRGLLLSGHPNDWQLYTEWYHPDFTSGVIYFNSWDELNAIIKGEGIYTKDYFAAKKEAARLIMERVRKATLDGYAKLYSAARQYACEVNNQTDVLSAGMSGTSWFPAAEVIALTSLPAPWLRCASGMSYMHIVAVGLLVLTCLFCWNVCRNFRKLKRPVLSVPGLSNRIR